MTYQTDAFNHGIGNSTVSKQWFSRSNDEKFLSLEEMYNAKKLTLIVWIKLLLIRIRS